MTRYILLLTLIGLWVGCQAPQDQNEDQETTEESSLTNDTIIPAFPDDFLGRWSGTLRIWRGDGLAQSVPMQLRIEPVDDSNYTYTIIYGEDEEAGLRDYMLKPVDTANGHWYVDEQNGIFLDGYYLGGIFYESFSVMGSRLTASLELRGDELIYAITSGSEEVVRMSGDTIMDGEEIPHVASYGTNVYQRASLRRQ
ncbi:MAG: hypothetical protein AAFR97_08375 [Bacteroidota bacterium]